MSTRTGCLLPVPVPVPTSPPLRESSSTSPHGDSIQHLSCGGWGESAGVKFIQQMFMESLGDWGGWTRYLELLFQLRVR